MDVGVKHVGVPGEVSALWQAREYKRTSPLPTSYVMSRLHSGVACFPMEEAFPYPEAGMAPGRLHCSCTSWHDKWQRALCSSTLLMGFFGRIRTDGTDTLPIFRGSKTTAHVVSLCVLLIHFRTIKRFNDILIGSQWTKLNCL